MAKTIEHLEHDSQGIDYLDLDDIIMIEFQDNKNTRQSSYDTKHVISAEYIFYSISISIKKRDSLPKRLSSFMYLLSNCSVIKKTLAPFW